jgi:hypothetical protein
MMPHDLNIIIPIEVTVEGTVTSNNPVDKNIDSPKTVKPFEKSTLLRLEQPLNALLPNKYQ